MSDELKNDVFDALDRLHADPDRTDEQLRKDLEEIELYVREKREMWT
jgi:hypothetical protein